VVLDCSDNFATRHAVNAACVQHRRPLVSGAAIGFDAQISVYDTRQPEHPCYACVFPHEATYEEARCSTMGVFAPLVGIIGTMQAAEALKLLAGVGTSLAGRLQMLDARTMEWNEVRMARQPHCGVAALSGQRRPPLHRPDSPRRSSARAAGEGRRSGLSSTLAAAQRPWSRSRNACCPAVRAAAPLTHRQVAERLCARAHRPWLARRSAVVYAVGAQQRDLGERQLAHVDLCWPSPAGRRASSTPPGLIAASV
jgi:hypothetical protein